MRHREHVAAAACRYRRARWARSRRGELIRDLTGVVLDVEPGGAGDLAQYWAADKVVAIHRDDVARTSLSRECSDSPVTVELASENGQRLPFDNNCFDAAVCSLVLCQRADPAPLLSELRRVLKVNGKLVFLQHTQVERSGTYAGNASAPTRAESANRCRLDLDAETAIRESGLVLRRLEFFSPRPWFPLAGPVVQGIASRPSHQYEAELAWLTHSRDGSSD